MQIQFLVKRKCTHRYFSLGIVEIEYGTAPENWFPARLLQINSSLRWHIMRWKRLYMPASKDLKSFKLLIWKIVWNLLATTEIVVAHVSAINWDQPSQKLVKLLDTGQHCKREI